MFYGDYPEYPTTALFFDFKRTDYLRPDQQKLFFEMVKKKFGNAIILRSFTLFESAFHEISFWIEEKKVGSFIDRIIWRITDEPNWRIVDQMAIDLAEKISTLFEIDISARIVVINKNGKEQEGF